MLPKKQCKWCGEASPRHWPFQCRLNPKAHKAIKKQSSKQISYKDWLESVARPYLIAKLGNYCSCCRRPALGGEKLDIEHTLGVGSHAGLKRDLNNMTLMCRFPCHRNKTDHKPCHITQ